MLLSPRSAAVVVVAGLPGAGKTTLVAGEPRALDSDALREAWAPRLDRLPYRLWRPLVHAWHWLAIWAALRRPEGVIVVRPFTTGWLRRAVLRRARRHHPEVHLVVVEATPGQARAGQRARGRTIRERAMRRHERRWARADFAAEPWTTVTFVARSGLVPAPARKLRRNGHNGGHDRSSRGGGRASRGDPGAAGAGRGDGARGHRRVRRADRAAAR